MDTTKSKIKVLLCSPLTGTTGGIRTWTENISKYYLRITSSSNVSLTIADTGRSISVYANTGKLKRLFSGIWEYCKVISKICYCFAKSKYDVIHITTSASYSLIANILVLKIAKLAKAKSVVHFHFGRIPEVFKTGGWEKKLLIRVIKKANKVIVLDRRSLETLHEAGFENVVILSNPISEKVEQIARNEYNVKRLHEVLFVGHVVATKGVYELAQACASIEGVLLNIVGPIKPAVTNRLQAIYMECNRSLEDLKIWGELPLDQALEKMQHTTIFCLPSYTEGFPNVILESMACGCGIIATNVGAISEMLCFNGMERCGIIIPAKDIVALRNAIRHLYEDLEATIALGEKAKQKVLGCYSMPVVWEQMSSLWKELA